VRCMAVKVPQSRITLIPICCIHWPLGEKDILKEWVDRIASDSSVYGIMLGDSMDEARSHYRRHIKSYTDDDNSVEAGHAYHKEDIRNLAKIIKPAAKRIWGVLRGNHYTEFTDGTNSEQYLCQQLDLPYFGAMGWIRLNTKTVARSQVVKILLHHTGGSAGGRTTGGDVSALTRLEAGNDADIYIAGHTHRRWGIKEAVLTITTLDEVKPIERTRVFIRSGGLLKGFKGDSPTTTTRHTPSYPECACMRPTDLGFVRLGITWRDCKIEGTPGHLRKDRVTKVEYEIVS
jgi:predicted phosphodiesterase